MYNDSRPLLIDLYKQHADLRLMISYFSKREIFISVLKNLLYIHSKYIYKGSILFY